MVLIGLSAANMARPCSRVILQRQLTGHLAAAAFDTTFLWVLAFTAVAVIPASLLPRIRPAHG